MDLRLLLAAAFSLAYCSFIGLVMEHYYSNRQGYEFVDWRSLAASKCEDHLRKRLNDPLARQFSVWSSNIAELDERRFWVSGTLSVENYLGEWQDASYRCDLEISYKLTDPFDNQFWLVNAIDTQNDASLLRLTRVEVPYLK